MAFIYWNWQDKRTFMADINELGKIIYLMNVLSSILIAVIFFSSCSNRTNKKEEFQNQEFLNTEMYRLHARWVELMMTNHTMSEITKRYSEICHIRTSLSNLESTFDETLSSLEEDKLFRHLELLQNLEVFENEEFQQFKEKASNLKYKDQIQFISLLHIRLLNDLYIQQLEPNYQIDSVILKVDGPSLIKSGQSFEGKLTPIALQTFWNPGLIIQGDTFSSNTPIIPFTISDYQFGKNEIEGYYLINHNGLQTIPFKVSFEVK